MSQPLIPGRESPIAGTTTIDVIAACLGRAYKAAQMHTHEPDARAAAVWALKERLVLELRLEDPRFDSDAFIARVQHWYNVADGR